MAKRNPVRIGLFITEQTDNGYYHVHAEPVIIGPTLWEIRHSDQGGPAHNVPAHRIRNIGSSASDTGQDLWLYRLAVISQGDRSSRAVYAWNVEYRQVYSVDEQNADRMAATLKTIARRMRRQEDRYGAPSTFGAYLARVADAIGADAIVRTIEPGRAWSYDDNHHDILSIRDGVYQVDRMIAQWAEAIAS